MNKLIQFTKAYIASMRLYYAFVTGIAGWIGVSFYRFLRPESIDYGTSAIILAVLFLSWGINQIVNDYLGMKEDKINAPHRPMVTGELHPEIAMCVSFALLIVACIISWRLNPYSIIPILVGVLLNVVYEYAKAWSLMGNLVFGLSISMCSIYGFLAAGETLEPLITSNRICGLVLVVIINGLMTYYTYFKDYYGDKLAGKRTFIVKYGIDTARYAGIIGAFITTLLLGVFIATDLIPQEDIVYKDAFIFCAIITLFLQLWTAVLFFKYPRGERTYFSLVTNIRACVAGQITLIAIFNGTLALFLMNASYIFIGFLFDLYKDARS